MKKLLLGSAAVAVGAIVFSSPAFAQGLNLGIQGHTKLYTGWLDQDTTADSQFDERGGIAAVDNTSEDERSFDILRETEVHFTGETTLDNGLSVGVHIEADIDGATGENFSTEEAYAFFSGAWGRVNFGREDGAGYLLQVAAPSADSNIDGIRQYVQPVNYSIMGHYDSVRDLPAIGGVPQNNFHDISAKSLFTGINANTGARFQADDLFIDLDNDELGSGLALVAGTIAATAADVGDIRLGDGGAALLTNGAPALFSFDYDMAVSGTSNKLTYLTPVFNGFQLGASYTPEIGNSRDFLTGNNDDDSYMEYGDVWEIAARYEGQFDQVGITLGAGYVHAELESSNDNTGGGVNDDDDSLFYQDVNGNGTFEAATDRVLARFDDREAWNVGIDLDWGPFGLGAAYTEDNMGATGGLDRETWVVGLDYTTGPFKLGASYLNTDQEVATMEIETDRWTGGVVYTYGPGMTFRGSISYIEHEGFAGDVGDTDATSVLLGTQINF
mgnify:CR=1 FL=1